MRVGLSGLATSCESFESFFSVASSREGIVASQHMLTSARDVVRRERGREKDANIREGSEQPRWLGRRVFKSRKAWAEVGANTAVSAEAGWGAVKEMSVPQLRRAERIAPSQSRNAGLVRAFKDVV